MSDKYYHKLNLPDVPVADLSAIKAHKWKPFDHSIHPNASEVLSQEILSAFSNIGVTPGFIVFFTSIEPGTLENRWVHSDAMSTVDPRTLTSLQGVQWRPVSFGINFEIYSNVNVYRWYDVPEGTQVIWPDYSKGGLLYRAWLGGVHYGEERRHPGVPEGFQQADSVVIASKPVMVRTDIPHSTTYDIPPESTHRVGVSIRFYEDWSWDEATEIFRPLFLQ